MLAVSQYKLFNEYLFFSLHSMEAIQREIVLNLLVMIAI